MESDGSTQLWALYLPVSLLREAVGNGSGTGVYGVSRGHVVAEAEGSRESLGPR